jgi:hypothetical protein
VFSGTIQTDGNITANANSNIVISTTDGNTNYDWTFDTNGNLTLPGGGTIFGNPYTPSGSPGNTITLQPAGSGTITDQRLLIYPTLADGDHIHMVTGNLYQTELFLGSDNLYVKLANTGNIVINSDDGNSNTAMWTFGTDGNLTLPGNIVGSNLASPAPYISGFDSISLIGTGTVVNASAGNILTNEVTGTKFNFLNGLYTATVTGSGATSNYSLNLPTNAGANGQLLSTDGTGNLSWANVTGLMNETLIVDSVGYSNANSWQGTYTGSGGKLLVTAFGAAYATGSAGARTYALQKNGSNVVIGTFVFNNMSVHTYLPAISYIDTSGNTSPATWRLVLGPNLVTSIDDEGTIIVTEFTGTPLDFNAGNITASGNLSVVGNITNSGIINKASGIVNAGVDVTLGNLKARMAASGNRSLQVSTVTGTYTVSGSSTYSQSGTVAGNTINAGTPVTINTTPAYLNPSYNFIADGTTDIWNIYDTGNNIAWRITLIVGASYNNNMISIERLV